MRGVSGIGVHHRNINSTGREMRPSFFVILGGATVVGEHRPSITVLARQRGREVVCLVRDSHKMTHSREGVGLRGRDGEQLAVADSGSILFIECSLRVEQNCGNCCSREASRMVENLLTDFCGRKVEVRCLCVV